MIFSSRKAAIPEGQFRSSRGVMISAALLCAVSALVITGPAPAQAQAGYRVCGAYNSSNQSGGYGTGLIVKVANGGDSTCQSKLQFMKKYYGNAWQGSTAVKFFSMDTCEHFAVATGMPQITSQLDPCPGMAVNKIYRYYSTLDLKHPSRKPHVDAQPWHN
ncbi:hypothetical protein [Curtobacterium flaccumfaciens]|nr:hypothetical protein [Curtobacterium flaccumfaciens]MBT1607993.1 hypothetical protein [Curtobacterium flaccumfaciens pv. betae]MBT1658224.1 hypothetical protein [Curtobacterium flaccumfaciens pv. betae]MCS0471748.1 hypothetical protein [Curtobacterium flaccumfaciens pv. betae]MCS0476295.1 hypothetical protein [Curtobacterium flaccumfaciens pv. betae]MCS0483146.1 hypothetical protein [Curtobacterium flaccumfaciens pv. betae]